MKSDKRLQTRLSIAVICCAVCSVLYSWGGVEMKWLRRFVMPAVFYATAFGLTKDWRTILTAPLSIIGLCLGYGATEVWMKIVKRTYCAFLIGGGLSLCAIHTAFCIAMSIILGVFNPFPARCEEMILGFVYSSSIFFYIWRERAS